MMSKENELNLAEQYFKESEVLFAEAKYEEALKLAKKASVLYEKWEAWKGVVRAGNDIAKMYCYLGKYHRAVKHMEGVLTKSEIYFGERHPITLNCLNSMGLCHDIIRNSEQALFFFQKALSIWRADFGNHPQMALVHNNIAGIYSDFEDFDLSVLHYQEALWIHQKYQENESVASVLGNLGMCLSRKGEYESGIEHCKKSLALKKEIYSPEHPLVASAYHYLARAYIAKRDFSNALPHYQESIKLKKKTLGERHPEVAYSLEGIAICLLESGSHDQAIPYFQEVLELSKEFFGEQSAELARSFLNIGRCYAFKKNYDLALAQLQEGIILLNPNFSDSNVYQNPVISKTYNYEKLDIYRYLFETKVDVFSKKYKEQTLNPKDLQASLEASIVIAEFIAYQRQGQKMEGSKYVLIKNVAELYDFAIKTSVEVFELYKTSIKIPSSPEFTHIPYTLEGAKALSFDFSEHCKAVLLFSSLKDNEAKANANIPSELLEKEKVLLKELGELDKQMNLSKANGDEKDEKLAAAIQKQYLRQKQNYDELIAQLEKDYPEYYQLKYEVSTASIQDLQSYLLDKKVSDTLHHDKSLGLSGLESQIKQLEVSDTSTTILSYHIAAEQIYIFAITFNDYQIAAIPKPDDFSTTIKKLQNAIQLGHIENFIESSTQLFDCLLQPVWNVLQSVNNLVIIPHGELYYVPFDVLINQHQITDHQNFEKLPYLIRDFNISYHYSATMLLHSHKRQQKTGNQLDSFFGLAPIQFGEEKNNEKKQGYVVKSSGENKLQRRRILKASSDTNAALQDLEETEAEVKEVYQLFEEQGKEAIALFYDQANKQNLQQYIGDYKYVLISTHGFLQETGKRTLSGIHLAPVGNQGSGVRGQESGVRNQGSGVREQESGVRSQGSGVKQEESTASTEYLQSINQASIADNDYILHTSETYHLNLNADLVVLSSCESGVGELKVGEGMMALNRGFLYAGASNIVYSLFKVPQDSTSRLTQNLFRNILNGDSYSAALRKAKLELIADEMMEPMDWAGFALVGV